MKVSIKLFKVVKSLKTYSFSNNQVDRAFSYRVLIVAILVLQIEAYKNGNSNQKLHLRQIIDTS